MNKTDRENKTHAILMNAMDTMADQINDLPLTESEKEECGVRICASLSARFVTACLDDTNAIMIFMGVFHDHYNAMAEKRGYPKIELKMHDGRPKPAEGN